MNKKILISLSCFVIAIILFFVIWKISDKEEEPIHNISQNSISDNGDAKNVWKVSDSIEDECTEEWKEYNLELQNAFENASYSLDEQNTHYMLKSDEGYISVYYLDEEGKEYLYKKTSIAVDYLSEEDIENLKKGIDVVGIEALNMILEDFE